MMMITKLASANSIDASCFAQKAICACGHDQVIAGSIGFHVIDACSPTGRHPASFRTSSVSISRKKMVLPVRIELTTSALPKFARPYATLFYSTITYVFH
jgi:hypothetical protein